MKLFEINRCFFTDLPIYEVQTRIIGFQYKVLAYGFEYLIILPTIASTWDKMEFFEENKHIFASFMYNGIWVNNQRAPLSMSILEQLLKEKTYPKTPEQKLENLFLFFIKSRRYDGEPFKFADNFFNEKIWRQFYFKTQQETIFYFKVLHEKGLIKGVFSGFSFDNLEKILSLEITYKGLEESIKMEQEGESSKKCFIAMSFASDKMEIRKAIKEAVTETGFEPIIIDEKDIDSDKTINDSIIANLKMCKFCIADFTGHSKGVYFESGFALGQNKKVIYTCQEDSFKDAHFDIKPLQHIIYTTTEQLKKDLINKINAWVK